MWFWHMITSVDSAACVTISVQQSRLDVYHVMQVATPSISWQCLPLSMKQSSQRCTTTTAAWQLRSPLRWRERTSCCCLSRTGGGMRSRGWAISHGAARQSPGAAGGAAETSSSRTSPGCQSLLFCPSCARALCAPTVGSHLGTQSRF